MVVLRQSWVWDWVLRPPRVFAIAVSEPFTKKCGEAQHTRYDAGADGDAEPDELILGSGFRLGLSEFGLMFGLDPEAAVHHEIPARVDALGDEAQPRDLRHEAN